MEENEKNINENIIVSKKIMIFSAVLLTILGIVYAVVYFSSFYNNSRNQEGELKEITCSGTLKYLIDDYYNIVESIEISESDATKFYNKIDFNELKKVDELSDYSYELEVCDLKISVSSDNKIAYYKNEYYDLNKYEDEVTTLIEKYFDEKSNVLFYSLGDNVISYPLSIENQKVIRNEIEKIDFSMASVDLFISGNYLLIVDNQRIYFDDFDGYAQYNDSIVKLSDDLLSLLKLSTNAMTENGACCTCCPDLEPGEYCIEACCSCAITK